MDYLPHGAGYLKSINKIFVGCWKYGLKDGLFYVESKT